VRRPLAGLVLALAAPALASGCGTGADRATARSVAERFYAAAAHGDGGTACAQLSPDLRAQLVKDEPGDRCAKAVLKLTLHGRTARSVQVYAISAQVDLVEGDTVFLGDTQEGWRIEAVGCRPQGSGPFECEEQA
jgi:hypothetical protein